MKQLFIPVIVLSALAALLSPKEAHAQTGNTGIGTTTPGSKLTVNGSFAAAYMPITATTYAAGENDFYIVWNGTAAGTVTLPVSTSGSDRTGRLYFFKNTSAVYTLTIDANGTELIDNVQTVLLQPGESAVLVKTNINAPTGVTYEVALFGKTQAGYQLSVSSTTSQTFADGSGTTPLNFTTVEYNPGGGSDFNLATDVWTCPKTGVYRIQAENQGNQNVAGSSPGYYTLNIEKNSVFIWWMGFALFTTNNSGSTSTILNLLQGDQVRLSISQCGGCPSLPTHTSIKRRFEITGL